ncbi:primosomal protein N' [Leuconostoc palmae]|uniref:primosomal protein N' n=1 Tax=Leuconostoc palmae TaxID=501487 RepID=UPI001C7D1000|nr:primosomal protein N' [Leuconostoc palmae]
MKKNPYAQIIVDVPTMQTNQPYTYEIPDYMLDTVKPGMRVEVPFGHRHVMGFIIALSNKELGDEIQLKKIIKTLDISPVLNSELLQLSEYLAKETFAFRISILQTMLPTALKANYQLKIKIVGEISSEIQQVVFNGLNELVLDAGNVQNKDMMLFSKLKREGKIEVIPKISNKSSVKKQLAYKFSNEKKFLDQEKQHIQKRAAKQHLILDFILAHLGETWTKKELQDMLAISPASLNDAASKKWLTKTTVELLRNPLSDMQVKPTEPIPLNIEQKLAYEQILLAAEKQIYQPFLLEGITGSGKTEVYLQVAQNVFEQGKTTLFLVPEISLTPQMVRRVKSRFGGQTAVLHSGLSDGERYDEWRRIERGEVKIVVGARSAVFAPLDNLGLIIVDEEHETTYKQNDNPRYNARDVALWRGAYHHIPVILGSATPSLESRARAHRNIYQFLKLNKRAGDAKLPKVTIVDMKDTLSNYPETDFSEQLREALKERLIHREQSVLMLNRRGFSSFVMCRDCGYVPRDPNCNLAMTLHMDTKTLKCHYCGYEESIPHICPNCHSNRIRYYGTGTEKVEKELQTLFPEARIIRLDQDTTRKKGSMDKLLTQFGDHKADILLGTQMIAKGLDFPDVTLVGVLNADTSLGLPDFHASERTFQLLTQVSGRAGRGEKKGEVIVQTFNPAHYAIRYASKHDYEGFYRQEMSVRHLGNYPPYYYTVQIQASHTEENVVAKQMTQIGRWLKNNTNDDVILLGPSPKPIAKLRNKYFFQIILKFKQRESLDDLLEELNFRAQKAKDGLQIMIDRDPNSFL